VIVAVVALWIVVAGAVYAAAPRRYAFWVVAIGGWILLPAANYNTVLDPERFPYWIVGSGLPSDLLWTKAWIAPAIALAASILFEFSRWRRLRPRWYDIPLVLFCLWPAGQGLLIDQPDPAPWVGTLYLVGAWGLPWLAGRLFLRDHEDVRAFAEVFAVSTATLLPFAIFEGLTPHRLYALFYADHPFALDGIHRYVGYRPQMFFEHGNQYGLWVAAASVAAAWRWRQAKGEPSGKPWALIAILLVAMTLFAQSAGAIFLMILCLAMLFVEKSFPIFRRLVPLGLGVALFAGALHVSGIVPIRSLVTETLPGKTLLEGLRATGRGSAAWRVGQDIKTLPLLHGNLLVGAGQWDWFAPAKTRPWGLPLLILGQFGLIGVAFAAAAIVAALSRHLSRAAGGDSAAMLCCLFVLLFAADALLNSFLLYPAIAVAGASTVVGTRQARSRQDPA
jgi:hypothetical protein